MDHAPNSDTFRRHYLNRHVCADLWAIHRDRNPQKALLRQATSHGGSRDSRRSFTLSGDQIKSIKKDRQYQHLTAQYESKSIGNRFSEKRKEVGRKRRNLFLRLKSAKLKEVAAEWTRQQALKDVEQQIRGDTGDFSADAHENQEREKLALMSDAQRKMYKALTAPLVNNYEAICQRRFGDPGSCGILL
ncbi:hypothetical protein F5883DRAFT_526946 [Diaporthe sp. PMI_573]|nr:hypothetical protein F5883DRAFT_526946 [Diaporthaceae sp. PMI_573]